LVEGERRENLRAPRRCQDLETLRELLEAGTVTSIIDRTFPLSAVADAIRVHEEGPRTRQGRHYGVRHDQPAEDRRGRTNWRSTGR